MTTKQYDRYAELRYEAESARNCYVLAAMWDKPQGEQERLYERMELCLANLDAFFARPSGGQ